MTAANHTAVIIYTVCICMEAPQTINRAGLGSVFL